MSSDQKPLTPEEFLAGIEQSASRLTVKGILELLEQAKAWSAVYYHGEIPGLIKYRVERIERQWVY